MKKLPKPFRLLPCGICLLLGSLLLLGTSLNSVYAEDQIPFDVEHFLEHVQPMTVDMTDRQMIMLWRQPDLPFDPATASMDEMVDVINALASRGVLLNVQIIHKHADQRAGLPEAKHLRLAEAIVNAGLPLHLLIPHIPFAVEGLWPDQNNWVTWQDKSFPVVDRFDTSLAVGNLRENIQAFTQLGLPIAGLWSDHETQPLPWNGTFYAFNKVPENRAKLLNPDAANSFEIFKQYTSDLRAEIFNQIYLQTLATLAPNALWGNYCFVDSGYQTPAFDVLGNTHAVRQLADGVVSMPNVYAYGRHLSRYIEPQEATQQRVDEIFYHMTLRTFSSTARNTPINCPIISYIGPFVDTSDDFPLGMSRPSYREMMRHMWLRGNDGMYVFHTSTDPDPSSNKSALKNFQCIEDTRAIMEETLTYRDFLENGQPMNFEWPEPEYDGVIWSGLELQDRALIRLITRGQASVPITITLSNGQQNQLTATPNGQYVVITKCQ